MDRTFSADTHFQRNPDQLYSQIDGEIVMLNTESSEYYGLNEVSSNIWDFLDTPKRSIEIVDHLMGKYDVDRNTCIEDLNNFLSESLIVGILELVNH